MSGFFDAIWPDSLANVDDSIDRAVFTHLPFGLGEKATNWLDQDAKDIAARNADQQAHPTNGWLQQHGMGWLGDAVEGTGKSGLYAAGAVDHGLRSVPGVGGGIGFMLDLGNRAATTVGYVGQSADSRSRGGQDVGDWLGEFTNLDSWGRAWNLWGKQGTLSAGELFAARISHMGDPRFELANPFDAKTAQMLKDASHATLFGQIMGAATDLTMGFLSPIPGASLVKAAARAGRIDSATLHAVSDIAKERQAADRAGQAPLWTPASAGQPEVRVTDDLMRQQIEKIKATDKRINAGEDGLAEQRAEQIADLHKMQDMSGLPHSHVEAPVIPFGEQYPSDRFAGKNGVQNRTPRKFQLPEKPDQPALADMPEHAPLSRGDRFRMKAVDTARAYVGLPVDPQHVYDRLADSLRRTDGIMDQSMMRDHLYPWFENAPEADRIKLTDLFTEANYIADPTARLHAKMNMLLGAMGSESAKAELGRVAPLLAASLEEKSAGPISHDIWQMVLDEYRRGGELRITDILAKFMDLPKEQAILDHLYGQVAQAKTARAYARRNVAAMRANAPVTEAHVGVLHTTATILQGKLDRVLNGEADVSLLMNDSAFKAWSKAHEVGGVENAVPNYRQFLDEAWTREMEAGLRLDSPNRAAQIAEHDQQMAHVQRQLGRSQKELDRLQSIHREQQVRVEAQKANVDWERQHHELDRMGKVLEDLYSLRADEGFIGSAAPGPLASLKTAYRDYVGEHHTFASGSNVNHPIIFHVLPRALNAIGTPFARGGINIADADRGSREFGDSLKRSGQFQPDEVRDYVNEFLKAKGAGRAQVVDTAHRQMLKSMAFNIAHMNEREAADFTRMSFQAYDSGRKHLATAVAGTSPDADVTLVRDADRVYHGFDRAFLKSHLDETVRFIDPAIFERALLRARKGAKLSEKAKLKARRTGDLTVEGVDYLHDIWRHATLMRPGLGVRAMLDTGLRGTALLGASTQFVQAMNGTRRSMLNKGERFATRRGWMNEGEQANARQRMMGLESFDVPISRGGRPVEDPNGFNQMAVSGYPLSGGTVTSSAYKDASHANMLRRQLSAGKMLHEAMLESYSRLYADLKLDTSKWEKYDADSYYWPVAWRASAEELMASPTAKHLLDHVERSHEDYLPPPEGMDEAGVAAYNAQWVQDQAPDLYSLKNQVFRRPEVEAEYREMGVPEGLSRDQWLGTLVYELHTVFPTHEALELAKSGTVTDTAVKALFPKGKRFDLPGPRSILPKDNLPNRFRRARDGFYKAFLDDPDYWMARHPVYVTTYRRTLQDEARRLVNSMPEGYVIPENVFETLKSRARSFAETTVRNTFYDTQRVTSFGQVMSRIAPFYRPWEDAMMSWGKLAYQNPALPFRLGGAWNSFDNLNAYTPTPLLVDGEGRRVQRGQKAPDSGVYIAVPGSKWLTKRLTGVPVAAMWRKEALNSIAQGNIWWSPGVGPSVLVPATLIMQQLPRDVVAAMAGPDADPLVRFGLKNMYLNGEIPATNPVSVLTQVIPASWRNAFRDTMGVNAAMTMMWDINRQKMVADRLGVKFDPEKATAHASKVALVAAAVRLIAQTGMGMSGRATTEGQFYVDQMHILEAIPADELKRRGFNSPQDAFAAQFPDAADLDWRFGTNATGVTASVNAQVSAAKLEKVIDKYPDMGWFIIGGDNIAQGRPGDEFSMSAYNQQKARGYGLNNARRTQPDVGQAVSDSLTAIGWKEWDKYALAVDEYARRKGLPAAFKSYAKQKFAADLGKQYPSWLNEYTHRNDRATNFFIKADDLAKRPELAKRPDMVMYVSYRQAMQDTLNHYGIKSLDGKTAPYAAARARLRNIGEQMSSENIGFSQVWERVLSGQVDPQETDEQVLREAVGGAG